MCPWLRNPVVLAVASFLLAGSSFRVVGQTIEEAEAAFDRGYQLADQEKHAESAAAYERALQLYRLVEGENSHNVAITLNNLANQYNHMYQYSRAETLYLRGLAIVEILNGKDHPKNILFLNNLAKLYKELGQYSKAEPLFLSCLAIREAQFGKDHPETTTALNDLAFLYKSMGRYGQAEQLFQRCLTILESRKDHPQTYLALNNLALLYHDSLNQYSRAEQLYQRSLALCESRFGKGHPETITFLNNLASIYCETGQFARAKLLYQCSLDICEARLGKDHHITANTLDFLGYVYCNLGGQLDRAESFYQRSLAIRQTRFGKNHPETTKSLDRLARVYVNLGQFARAESLQQGSLGICETWFGKEHPDTVTTLDRLAEIYRALGQYARAEPLNRRCLAINEARFGKDSPRIIYSLNDLAFLCECMSKYYEAERLYLRSLEICEKKVGIDSGQTADTLNGLAVLYHSLGQYERAEGLYRRILAINEVRFGKNDTCQHTVLSNLANLYLDMGQYEKTILFCRRSLAASEARFGRDSVQTWGCLYKLATLYRETDQYDLAEKCYERCLGIINKGKFPKNHPATGTALANMGLLYQKVGKYSRAESLFLRALEIQEALLPKDNFYSASTLHHLGMLYADKNQWGDALHHADRGRRSLTRQATSILPSLAESEQRTFLRNIIQSTLQKSLSLGFVRANDSNVADFSGAWLVNHKGLSFQTLAEQHRLSSEAKNPKVRGLVDQLQQTRAFLSRLLQQFPQPGLEQAHQEQRQKLYQKERDLAQQLARTVGRPFRENPWVEIQEIRGKLGTQTVLIDLVRFPVWDFKNRRWQPARYLAWITPPADKGSVQIIDLGEANPIDQAIQAARKAIMKAPQEIRHQGELEVGKQARVPFQALARKILYPLLDHIKDYPEWIVSPDGALWLVPWSALPLPDGQYVVEQHSIRYVVSGRELVIEYPKTQTETPWLFADPDFDLTPAQVAAAANGLFRNLGPPAGLSLAGRRLLGRIGNWRITFAFQENGQVLICDEDDNGKVIGQGPWQLNGNTLTMTSENYHYVGMVQGARVSGQRTGTLGTDPWEIRLAGGDLGMAQLRSAGTAGGILPKVNRLPFTAAEAEAVRPWVKAWTTMEPKVVMGEEAGEAVVKAVRRPRVLMLSTHGYFLPEQEVKLPDRLSGLSLDEMRPRVVLDVQGKPLENPLLRCGLLLAGCNQRQQVQGDEDDGLLTGMEIVGLDLRGCELVVLSACETGLGDVRTGEGVAGLRQAFQLAGASAVVATLWSIPDRDSARLMSDFFGNLAKGQGKAAALREAQLMRIKAHRERTGAAHPFFWAAFTLTGQ